MLGRPRVLLVEDNDHARLAFRTALTHDGWLVFEAPDGATALEIAAKERPDLIVQDLLLPDMDAYQLLRELRALPGGAERPILVLSGWLTKMADARRRGLTFNAYVPKPIGAAQLCQAVAPYRPAALG